MLPVVPVRDSKTSNGPVLTLRRRAGSSSSLP
ncbi:DUF397 domain-containing protein [Streptomyces sp. GD-15H]